MIESPYAGDVKANEAYARRCMLDALTRGDIPIVTHLMWTQVWDDMDPEVREAALLNCRKLRRHIGHAVFYVDLGLSDGMERASDECLIDRVTVEVRTLRDAI